MDKITFDKFLSDATVGMTANFKFVSALSHLTGEYIVGSRKIGPGRGGSTLLTLTNKETGVNLTSFETTLATGEAKKINMGSPAKDYIDSITMNEVVYESSNPMIAYPKNADKAQEFFNIMGTVKVGNTVHIDANVPQMCGDWNVLKIEKTPGAPPQRKLSLERVEGENKLSVDVLSYKMSGIIKSINVVNPPAAEVSVNNADDGNPVGV